MSAWPLVLLLSLIPLGAQVFRAEARLVRVSVWSDGRPLLGDLEGFTVTDAGVRQRVVSVDRLLGPLDVTVIVESRGIDRSLPLEAIAGRSSRASASLASEMSAALGHVRAGLRQEDTLTTLDASGGISVFGHAPAYSRESAVLDAVAMALTMAPKKDRNQVVVVVSNGYDTLSVTTRELRLQTVARSTAPVFAALIRRGNPAAAASREWANGRVVAVAPVGAVDSGVAEMARASGGWVTEVPAATRIAEAVQKAIEAYRSGYLLAYAPTNVSRGGWHPIEVTHRSGAALRHRAGYVDDGR